MTLIIGQSRGFRVEICRFW